MSRVREFGWASVALLGTALLGMSVVRAQDKNKESFEDRSCITTTCFRKNGESVQRYQCLLQASALCTLTIKNEEQCNEVCESNADFPARCFKNFACLNDKGQVEFIEHCALGQTQTTCLDSIRPNCKASCF